MLHKTFKNVNKAAGIVKQEVRAGYFRQSDQEKVARLKHLSEKLAAVYDVVPVGEISIDPGLPSYGRYNIATKKVILQKPSIVSLLHEFRHHLQHQGNIRIVKDKEHDAQGWACSVYFKACPKLFTKAAREGKIKGVTLCNS